MKHSEKRPQAEGTENAKVLSVQLAPGLEAPHSLKRTVSYKRVFRIWLSNWHWVINSINSC